MSKNQALSLRTQWLGDRLRAARERAGYTLKDVGAYIGLDFTLIGKFERGTNPIRPAYIRDLISFYGISNQRERDALLRLNEDVWRKDWWDGDTGDLETSFIDYTWIEARAGHIHVYDPLLINGLLQAADYARAVTIAGLEGADEETIDRMVEVRLRRQRILDGVEATNLTVILEEAALCRRIGTPETMRKQMKHLGALATRENIVLRVIPSDSGWHTGLHGPYTYFKMRDPFPDAVYIESMTGRSFLEDEAKVERYRQAYDRLGEAAFSRSESIDFIETKLKDLS